MKGHFDELRNIQVKEKQMKEANTEPLNPEGVNAEPEVIDEVAEAEIADTEVKPEIRLIGKIIKVSAKGYGFISAKDIPFTRIFFHWTSLKPNTLNFKELKSGMKVSFVAIQVENKGFRAIKIQVEE